jgi:hypothetical protein
MTDKLIDIQELIPLLGDKDIRTIEGWCSKNNLPVIKLGKKKYTVSYFLDHFIENELKTFIDKNFANPDAIMDAVKQDSKAELSELLKAPIEQKTKNNFKVKVHSKEAEKFINEFNA